MRRILCLYLPNWPIQRLCAANRELDHSRPIILHDRDSRRGHVVTATNTAGARCGVRLNAPLTEAAALVSRLGTHQAFPADHAADTTALQGLAEHCDCFSPLVGWATTGDENSSRDPNAVQPAWLYLDVTGIGVLFGGEQGLAHAVQQDCGHRGYRSRVAIADTIGAAWAIATCHQVTPYICLPGEQAEILKELPLSALRVPVRTAEVLYHLGFTQIGQLATLPRASLATRFGELLSLRLDQLFGDATETIISYSPLPRFLIDHALEYPAESRTAIERLISESVARLASELAQCRKGAVQLSCRLDCEPGKPVWLDLSLFRPSADPRHWWDLIRTKLEQTKLPGPVGRLTLTASLVAPLENRQQELFAGNRQEADRQFSLLIDRLSSRLGSQSVVVPTLTADPVPERAVRYVPMTDQQKRRRTITAPPAPASRPLLLHDRPLPLKVLAVAPDGPLQAFWLADERHDVIHIRGPERIESGWWRGRSVRRDYYRVEAASGQRYWLFRRLQDGRWFLHGEFS